jgi:hypothetical protein
MCAMISVSITLLLSSFFLAMIPQKHFLQKSMESMRKGEIHHRSETPLLASYLSDPSYTDGYLRGEEDAYADASRYLSGGGLAALALGEVMLFAYLAGLFIFPYLNRKKQSAVGL